MVSTDEREPWGGHEAAMLTLAGALGVHLYLRRTR